MMTISAGSLQAGDEFTTDGGATWAKVKVVRSAYAGKRTVVIGTDDKERIFKSDAEVIVKI